MIALYGYVEELRAAGVKLVADSSSWTAIRAEFVKLKHELDHDNRSGLARALAEVAYTAYQIAAAHEIRLDVAIKEIHRCHMRDAGGAASSVPIMTGAIARRKP